MFKFVRNYIHAYYEVKHLNKMKKPRQKSIWNKNLQIVQGKAVFEFQLNRQAVL